MFLEFKNNNIYYNNYKILDGRLSLLLVPIGILIILCFKKYIKYFSYIFICIAIIGIIDSYYVYLKNKHLILLILFAILTHGALLYPLINIKKYLEINIFTIIFFILSIIIVRFLPYWPYELTKNEMIYLLIIIRILMYLIYIFSSQ